MRAVAFGFLLCAAVLMTKAGNAQIDPFRTAPPPVATEYAAWQFNGEPILVLGIVYYPTRETRIFDGQSMAQIDTYQRVPVYTDVTREPNSVVYVPIGRTLLRGYERRRNRELVGLEAGRISVLPLESPSVAPRTELAAAVGGMGNTGPVNVAGSGDFGTADIPFPTHTRMESILRPRGTSGVWLEFDGSLWYSHGPAVVYSADRFMKIGEYRGFPVYRAKSGSRNEIWVSTTKDGPVAPYTKR